jgi:hypothetical protein
VSLDQPHLNQTGFSILHFLVFHPPSKSFSILRFNP